MVVNQWERMKVAVAQLKRESARSIDGCEREGTDAVRIWEYSKDGFCFFSFLSNWVGHDSSKSETRNAQDGTQLCDLMILLWFFNDLALILLQNEILRAVKTGRGE